MFTVSTAFSICCAQISVTSLGAPNLDMLANCHEVGAHIDLSPIWNAANKGKNKGGANKKSASPTFKKSASPVSVKDSGCVDIMFEIFKAYDGKAHVCCFYLQKGLTDGSSNQSMTPLRLVNWQMTVSSLPILLCVSPVT
jgi:hypothetical protein